MLISRKDFDATNYVLCMVEQGSYNPVEGVVMADTVEGIVVVEEAKEGSIVTSVKKGNLAVMPVAVFQFLVDQTQNKAEEETNESD